MNIDKIVCLGKNYADHMLELGDAAVESPVIFLKPYSCLKQAANWNDVFEIELMNEDIHYECEIVLSLSVGGYQMSLEQAQNAIKYYSIGLDLTRRNLQRQLKDKGHPWTVAKVFPNAAIIAPWLEYKQEELENTNFNFILDAQLKQSAHVKDMLFAPAKLIQYVSQFFYLHPGDILFTGTPGGVGKLDRKSEAQLVINNHTLNCKIF